MISNFFFFLRDTAPTEIYTLSLHDALPISWPTARMLMCRQKSLSGSESNITTRKTSKPPRTSRSEEHTSELQSRGHLVCRLLLEKKKDNREDRLTSLHHRASDA